MAKLWVIAHSKVKSRVVLCTGLVAVVALVKCSCWLWFMSTSCKP